MWMIHKTALGFDQATAHHKRYKHTHPPTPNNVTMVYTSLKLRASIYSHSVHKCMCMIAYHWNTTWDYRCWKILCTCPSCICKSKSLTLSSTCWICRTYKEKIMMKYSSHRHHTCTIEAKYGYTSIIRHLWIPHTSRITSNKKTNGTKLMNIYKQCIQKYKMYWMNV